MTYLEAVQFYLNLFLILTVDTDGDGIPDHLDHDDDGDGIPDHQDSQPLKSR